MPGERDDGEVDERADGYREKDRAALDVEKLGRIADKKGTKCVARDAPDDRDAEDIGDRPAVVRDHLADRACRTVLARRAVARRLAVDRKSTRLNSSPSCATRMLASA